MHWYQYKGQISMTYPELFACVVAFDPPPDDSDLNGTEDIWQLPNFIEFLSQYSEEHPLISIRLFEKLMHTKSPTYFIQ